MVRPELVYYDTVDRYREHYERVYCQGPITTFDGIPVYFRKQDFDHAFYESSQRRGEKDVFSEDRSQRIDWLKATLESRQARLFKGWNKRERAYKASRRVSVVFDSYVVVISISIKRDGNLRGKFITAYWADSSIEKIKQAPVWNEEEFRKENSR